MRLNWMDESEYTRAVKKEKKFAQKYGGKAQPCSGRLIGFKGDIVLTDFLIEHKHTNSSQYILKVSTMEKINNEAMSIGKNSALVLEFSSYNNETYVVLKESVFKALTQP